MFKQYIYIYIDFHENFTYFYNFILVFYYIVIPRNKLKRNKCMTNEITIKVPEYFSLYKICADYFN